jgi:hypothetical protein
MYSVKNWARDANNADRGQCQTRQLPSAMTTSRYMISLSFSPYSKNIIQIGRLQCRRHLKRLRWATAVIST